MFLDMSKVSVTLMRVNNLNFLLFFASLLLYSSSKEKMSPESLNQNSLVSLSDTFSLSENISYMPLNYLPLHQENLYSYENRRKVYLILLRILSNYYFLFINFIRH
jgi:hypothetical protein